MSTSRLVPYVDIISQPSRLRNLEQQKSPDISLSPVRSRLIPYVDIVKHSPAVRSRLVPYVDIVKHASHRSVLRKRRSPQKSRSRSPTSATESSTRNISPRKRRRLDRNGTADEISASLTRVNLARQMSPTVSDFMSYDLDGSRTHEDGEGVPVESRSPSASSFSKGKSADREVLNYVVKDDEILEDADLRLPGETGPDDSESDDDEDIPVRVLSDFAIYNAKTMELVPVAQLLHMQYTSQQYGASGLVRAWIDEDEDEDVQDEDSEITSDEGYENMFLSNILEFCIHSAKDDDALDEKIYLRTHHAWYILGCPSYVYSPFFVPFWIQHRLLHLLISASMNDNRIGYNYFIKRLCYLDQAKDAIGTAKVILGRELDEKDLKSDDVMAYILSSLPDICAENHINISRVPLIRDILGQDFSDFDHHTPQGSQSKKKIIARHSTKTHNNKEKEVLKHRNNTFLTHVVNQMAKNLFEGSLEVAKSMDLDLGDNGTEDTAYIKLPQHKGHHSNPQNIVWGEKLDQTGGTYQSAVIDGIVYNIGDVVMVEPDLNAKVLRASQTVNKYGNRWWFCQIRYFYDKKSRSGNTKMFHGLWLTHGSRTLLQETSHSKALYLLDTCDNNPLTSIFKKCHVKFLRPGDEEVEDDGAHDSNDFHCGLFYDEEHVSFVDIPHGAISADVDSGETSCFGCDQQETFEKLSRISYTKSSITVHDVEYHVDDFVYIHPTKDSKLLDIAQITEIDQEQVHVTYLGRYDDYAQYQKELEGDEDLDLESDERRLFVREKSDIIPVHKIDGKCFVIHLIDQRKIEEWVKQDDCYYLNQEGSKKKLRSMDDEAFSYCEPCFEEAKKIRKEQKRFKQTNSKLVGMELFSGAGGLGIGMDISGFVETRYAVEFSPSAAKTYIANHPHTTVYCQDSNNLLKYAIDGVNSDGRKSAPVSKIDDKTLCPPLPKRSDNIDFIFGGPPCQSFSRANHSKRRDDIRSTLACNMLSYVEYYEPNYFLLENVGGFMDHKFYTRHELDDGTEVESEIRAGMVKFVLRTLIALGYQVRYKLLQAGQYGVPQSRRRVIFWGAKRGIALPDFPVPVYAFPAGAIRSTLPTGAKLNPPTRSKDPTECHYFAPLKARTVLEAIGDLPKFDWKNPHEIIKETARDRQEVQRRRNELNIPSFDAVREGISGLQPFDEYPGYPEGVAYQVAPQNRYQKWLRSDMGKDDLVTGQYTTRMASRVIEATTILPQKALADHHSLPDCVLPAYAQRRQRRKGRTYYGRMDGNGYFKCAMTTLAPGLKNQWPVHPEQKRIITVREAARSQGFPDDYVFESVNENPQKIIEDQLRQIGNAVAVPFALALGKELGKALIIDWEKKQREGSIPL